jgi:hypothetical protein
MSVSAELDPHPAPSDGNDVRSREGGSGKFEDVALGGHQTPA